MKIQLSTILKASVPLWVAVGAVVACGFTPPLEQERESGVIMRLPVGVGRYLGEAGEASKAEIDLLPEDTQLVKMNYRSAAYGPGTRDSMEVTIVLAGAERRSIHRPEVCLTGQGWTMLDAQTLTVEISPGNTLRVRDLLVEKTVHLPDGTPRPLRAHYVYWFVGTDVTTASHVERIWLTTRDSVVRNINHRWAYVSILALVTENFEPELIGERARTSAETVEMMTTLIRDLVPTFQKDFMPAHRP